MALIGATIGGNGLAPRAGARRRALSEERFHVMA